MILAKISLARVSKIALRKGTEFFFQGLFARVIDRLRSVAVAAVPIDYRA